MKMSVKMKLKNSVGMLLGVTVCAFTLLSQSQAVAANETKEDFGKYVGTVKSEWLPDGRKMKLLEDFLYEDPKGLSWKAPSGAIVDGASIPRIAWSVVGTPFYGKYRDASVIHDVACQEKKRSWEDVHLAFYNAMRASGVDQIKAKTMYAAVYHFGPRWSMIKLVSSQVISKLLNPKLDSQDSSVKKPLSEAEIILEYLRNKEIENNIELSVKIPAPKKTLTSEKFDELVVLIKKFEELGSPLSLEQIQAYK